MHDSQFVAPLSHIDASLSLSFSLKVLVFCYVVVMSCTGRYIKTKMICILFIFDFFDFRCSRWEREIYSVDGYGSVLSVGKLLEVC